MTQQKISVLGSGVVGEVLSNGFLKHGYSVCRGSRDPKKLSDWLSKAGPKARSGSFEEASQFGDIIVLAVKGTAAESTIRSLAPHLKGKVILDATNPIADQAPEKGVLRFFTDLNLSLMERLQQIAPEAHFVKAFSCVGNAFMVNPNFGSMKPTMFICGDKDSAKKLTTEILTQFGWNTEDMGAAVAARAIEPLCMLWCIPGFLRGQWNHAFSLLKA